MLFPNKKKKKVRGSISFHENGSLGKFNYVRRWNGRRMIKLQR